MPPEKKINSEFLSQLETVSNKIHPLAGATFKRSGEPDSRLSKLHVMAGSPLTGDITYYEQIAIIRNRHDGRFFVAFRQTMDALLLEFKDPLRYPEWLIKSDAKRAELKTYIYSVKMRDGIPLLPRTLPIIRTHEDWLEHVTISWVFDTIAYYLLKNKVITLDMYTRIK